MKKQKFNEMERKTLLIVITDERLFIHSKRTQLHFI